MGYTTLQRTGTRRPSGPSALADAALALIREGCQNLRFRADKTQAEQTQGYLGTSLRPHEIPYAMQMDVERLCLEKALERFYPPAPGRTPLTYISATWRCLWETMKRPAGASALAPRAL